MRTSLGVVIGLLAMVGCTRQVAESPMAGMTAEEHARMMAGGTQGAVDSAGVQVRDPVHLTVEQENALGVVYAVVTRGPLTRTIRTVGQIQPPETAIAEVTTKVEGFIEALAVGATGETVRAGAPLVTLYSPALVAAQEELLTARRLALSLDSTAGPAWQNAQALLAAARRRLLWWDVPEAWVTRVETSGVVQRTLTLPAPVSGVVLEKLAVVGQRVMSGMPLYRIAGLERVWVEGDVFEQDLRFVRVGSEAHIEVSAYPGEHSMAQISFIYPILDATSRTNRIRLVLPNPGLRLKPGMFATIYLDVTQGAALMVPSGAVIATGERNLVFVRTAEGMLVPRPVVVGVRAGEMVEILDGLAEGETVVRSANFLVDAESRLGSTGAGMPGMQHGQPATPVKPTPEPEPRHD